MIIYEENVMKYTKRVLGLISEFNKMQTRRSKYENKFYFILPTTKNLKFKIPFIWHQNMKHLVIN